MCEREGIYLTPPPNKINLEVPHLTSLELFEFSLRFSNLKKKMLLFELDFVNLFEQLSNLKEKISVLEGLILALLLTSAAMWN